jgi:hypothetical protein
LANQVRQKNGGALEHADEVHALAAKIARNLPAHFADPPLYGAAPQQYSQTLLLVTWH